MYKKWLNNTTIVNAPRGSGIGTFGLKFKAEFQKKEMIDYIEIDPTWKGLFSLWGELWNRNHKVIFNLGFTSFGKSIYKNFLNFLMLKLYSIINPSQSIILHDSIDTSNLEYSGYSNSRLLPIGGIIATKMLKNYNIFVFSKIFHDVLRDKYGFDKVKYFPFPCENESLTECYRINGEPLLLNLGYIAPYKGLEILPEIKAKLNNIKTMIIGNFYKSFLKTKVGPQYKKNLTDLMNRSGVVMAGYLDEEKVKELIKKNKTVAILPYISGYNASYSALFFIKLGIPVVATNLELFLEIQDNGAGIALAERTPGDFANAILKILNSQKLVETMIESDRKYCSKYSIKNFCEFLINNMKG